MSKEQAFQAYGNAGRVTKPTAKEAATAYFEQWPTSRKCNIIQGEDDGYFFTVNCGRASEGKWPTSYKDVTKKMVTTLGN